MRLIANKQFRYPYNSPLLIQKDEAFDCPDNHAKTLMFTGMARKAKREYKRRDMKAEDIQTVIMTDEK